MDSPDVSLLLDMGFSESKIKKALAMTGNNGVEPAMDWLLAHAEELDEPEPAAAAPTPVQMDPEPKPSTSSAPPPDENPVAKSLQCSECNKLFKSSAEVEFHAAKTGHVNFSESVEEKKPLTEEERLEQLRMLEQKVKEKRKEREEKEKHEEIEREKNRIKAGKEIAAAKKKLADDEMKKILDQRRREKEEDRIARQRVKEQIEADKLARKAKQAAAVEAAPPPVPPIASAPKEYDQTRIQIRLTNGSILTQSFSPKEQLSAVKLFVELNRTDGDIPFTFMTNFPKKVFTGEDFEKPLSALGLVPSAVLIVIKNL